MTMTMLLTGVDDANADAGVIGQVHHHLGAASYPSPLGRERVRRRPMVKITLTCPTWWSFPMVTTKHKSKQRLLNADQLIRAFRN